MEVYNLEPAALWQNFVKLNSVPRASKKEERVIAFMMDFGNSLGLETIKDAIGNVIIKKAASAGMEDRKTVILQSHLDMVHQKNSDTVFNFDEQGIEMYLDGDWVKARGTTLGADNGIGVAAIMAVLASENLEHPALEAMFTIDEETGMTGAKELDPVNFKGSILLNLDTEEDDELTIGCAGGIDTNTSYSYRQTAIKAESKAYKLKVKGLLGGHSGMDIHKGRANANKLMNRLLYFLSQKVDVQLSSLDGGSLRNAIPRESTAVVTIPVGQTEQFSQFIEEFSLLLNQEYGSIETALQISSEEDEMPSQAVAAEDFKKIINALYACPNGVFRMSPDIEGLVETSSNLARVILKDGEFHTQSLQRSSVESSKADVSAAIASTFENIGCEVQQDGDYPGWKPDSESDILQLSTSIYRVVFAENPKVEACHAGLECGILGSRIPGLDMISFGPTIRGAHSPDERVQVSSVKKFWNFLSALLKDIPKKTIN